MYNKIITRTGTVLILDQLINEVKPLLIKCNESINNQQSEDNLLCWIVDMFSEDFEEEYGSYPQEYLEKLALCILNAKYYLIKDKEQFCIDIGHEDIDLEIGFDETFYPEGLGQWYDLREFVFIEGLTQ